MTYGEIVQKVIMKVWGNSGAPANWLAELNGSGSTDENSGYVAEAHRALQSDYNYWFMEAAASLISVAGVQTYDLPAGYKELQSAVWEASTATVLSGTTTVDEAIVTGIDTSSLEGGEPLEGEGVADGAYVLTVDSSSQLTMSENATASGTVSITAHISKEYFTGPVKALNEQQAKSFWKSTAETDYPSYYEFFNGAMTLYHKPKSAKRLALTYWGFISRPPVTGFNDYTDAISDTMAQALIFMVAADVCEVLEEFNRAQVFKNRAAGFIASAKKEDSRRRQVQTARAKPRNVRF